VKTIKGKKKVLSDAYDEKLQIDDIYIPLILVIEKNFENKEALETTGT
jgi:hypothetical protein